MAEDRVSLVVTDLDGTLWHTDDDLRHDVVEAITTLAELGVPILVATGRRRASAAAPLARFGLAPPAVVLNGALGLDLATGERFHRNPYEPADAAAVLDGFTSVGLSPVVYVDRPDVDAYVGPRSSTHPEHARQILATGAVDDLHRVVAEEAVLGFGLIGVDPGAAAQGRDAVDGLAETHVDRSLDYPGMASMTVAPRGRSKWDGVVAFCRRHDLDADRVLAVADGTNDLELLDHAHVALVPAVAHPSALDRADVVIPAAADGGWVQVLDHLGPAGAATPA